jgi:hypothetical protein
MQAINGPRDDAAQGAQGGAGDDPLPQEFARQLASAVLALVRRLGTDGIELDAHDWLRLTRLARVQTALGEVLLVERAADPVEREVDGSTRRFSAYLADDDEAGADDDDADVGDDADGGDGDADNPRATRDPFALKPEQMLFVLHERAGQPGSAGPSEWGLQLLQDPRGWYNPVMAAMFALLEPLLPPLH